jgi:hypothetical protein
MTKVVFHPDYPAFLAALKERIVHARATAARAVNRELAFLYWDIGQAIVEKQQLLGWGESVIDRLSTDLQDAFPRATGFSPRNMRDMKRFYLAYSDESIWRQPVAKLAKSLSSDRNQNWRQAVAKLDESTDTTDILRQLVAQVPWGQHLLILNKLTDPTVRLYYLRATAQLGWSRSVLLNQIKARAYERAVKEKKTHNFALALPEHFAEQADEMMKSRYNLEFLGIRRPMQERELEDRLIECLQPLHPRVGLWLLLCRPPIPARSRAQGIFRRLTLLPPLSQGPGRLRSQDWLLRTGACGQDGFLP